MPFEQPRSPGRALFMGGVLALACGASAGCEAEFAKTRATETTRTVGSFHIAGVGMYEAFERWRATATREDQVVIEDLGGKKDLLIHVFLAVGRLSEEESRGGESGEASTRDMKLLCDFHPIVGTFRRERDWDVIYDPERTKKFEEDYGIPTPPEVVLQHEFFGHVVPVLRNPTLEDILANDGRLKKANECEALDVENRYRKRIGRQEVPPELMGCPSP